MGRTTRRNRPVPLVLAALALVAGTLALAAGPAAAAPAPSYPDLVSQIPAGGISITRDAQNHREFRYTHRVSNVGVGSLEIRPEYDPTTDNARGYQRLYQTENGTTSLQSEVVMGGNFLYHAIHGHYHYPLASFGLFAVQPDGSVGVPVAMSPKVGFCIADSLPISAGAGSSQHSPGNCGDPRATIGITPGWADEYDYRDDGQSIPIEGVADGTYWLRTIVDPDNFLVEANKANNITDVRVRITGDSVSVLETRSPVIPPPTVTLSAPRSGDTLNGVVTLSATAGDPSGVAGVEFLVDGTPIGTRQPSPPYQLSWDTTTIANGSHVVTARAYTGAGLRGSATAVMVYVANLGSGNQVTRDVSVSRDGTGTVTSPPLSTATAGETLVAFVGADGPGGTAQTATVSGGGLAWQLVRRANGQHGTSEVWTAKADQPLTGATFTSTLAAGGYDQSFTVVAFLNAGGVGASAGGSAATGPPSVSLTTTRDGSWVYGTGNDWDAAIARTLPADQAMLHQFVDTRAGDTMWTQSTLAPAPVAGTVVNLRDLAPAGDRWNLAVVEVLRSGPTVPGPVISNVLAGNRTSSSVRVTWTTDVASTSQVEYGTTLSYGATTPLGAPLSTQHQVDLTGLASETQYHYRVISTDAAGVSRRSVDFVFTTAAVSTIYCDLTAPAAGSTVSGTVTVSANASSTASVSGVQLKLDSTNLGAELTVPPYQFSWNTTTVANGPHVLTAVVRDPTGNSLTSAPVSVVVSNGTPPPPSGLVAAYAFGEGTGTTVGDRSGRGNVGTMNGATWSATGKYGGAASFNGTSARIDIPDSPSLRLSAGMTVEAWIRPGTTNATWRTAVLKERPGGLAYGLYGQTTASRPAGYVNVGGSDLEVRGSAALAANVWTHLAVTYDGSTMRIFRDGVQVGSTPASGALVSGTGALRIGGNAVWGEYFSGLIDEVRIYDRALSPTELARDRTTPI